LGPPLSVETGAARERLRGKVRRLTTFGDRLDNSWIKEREWKKTPDVAAINPLPLRDFRERHVRTQHNFFEPSVRSRYGFEERWVGLVTALESSSDHESHFNATSLHLQRDESLEVQYLWSGIFAGL